MINNEYWDGVGRFVRHSRWRDQREVASPMLDFISFRRTWTTNYSWTVSDPETLDFVRSHCPGRVLDPLAGTGWWAHLLRQGGVEVLASDACPPTRDSAENLFHPHVDPHIEVTELDAVEAMVFSDSEDTLLLSWPPPTSIAVKALSQFRGRRLVYMGEHGGTDATETFFDQLTEQWRPIDAHTPVQFECMNDAVSVWTRSP